MTRPNEENTMKHRKLGADLTVSAIGLGCMGMTYAYGGQEEAKSLETLRRAVDLGVNFFDTAEVYGPFDNEILLGKALRGLRDKVVIATKFGFTFDKNNGRASPITGVDSRPQHVKEVADASLKRLGIDVIDLYYQHRVDPKVPIEDTVGAMAGLVKEGKVTALGLSEASAATIRRAHKVHPISAVQSEYSLWTRDPEAEVLATCRELGIGFVPYSPLGRGFLAGAIRSTDALGEKDWRRTLPRFQADTIKANLSLVETLEGIARDKGVTTAQLALAWVLHQGNFIVPIPGVRKVKHLEDNIGAVDVTLTAKELSTIAAAVPKEAVAGKRYTEEALKLVNA
jgi:aryl-alcohol dehydrogenase-like predicted oxidoreductase